MIDRAALIAPIVDRELLLEPCSEHHREPLRIACAADADIWDIYPVNWSGHGFNPAFDAMIAHPQRDIFALILDGRVIGMSGYLNIVPERQTLEVGGTYIMPEVRGTGLNARIKRLLFDRAIACGVRRLEFRVDMRNLRSQRAIEKMGAIREGVLRAERITWKGHVRDTVIYSILADEWTASSTAG